MSENELFRTSRMEALRGTKPAYQPGSLVYLQRDLQEFPKGSAARIVSVETKGPGLHRYELTVGDQKMWSFEADIRPTPPRLPVAPVEPGNNSPLGPTQRMNTLTLSQRMATLGPGATQRMHALTQEERLRKMLQTNRMRTMDTSNPPSDPATGAPAGVPPKPPRP